MHKKLIQAEIVVMKNILITHSKAIIGHYQLEQVQINWFIFIHASWKHLLPN